MYLKSLAIISLLWSAVGYGDIVAPFKRDAVFEKTYVSNYEPRKCGENIMRLLRSWKKAGRDMRNYSLVRINNKGFSVFGMVNAERTRSWRFKKPAVAEKNWYFHVIAVDNDGYVYDYDFMTKPYVLSFKRYLYYMYLDQPECKKPTSGKFCAPAKDKMRDYKFQWFRATDMLTQSNPKPFFEGSMAKANKYAAYLGK